ncbi:MULTISPECIES: iron uptake porin [unclassified Microcoleus]|uniref:iron uptake porin n=1 Tax=unclassified Microcoleus TaxID=2642155 RepID=UPI0025EAF104|nr:MULTISPECIES: iron uptake porin [unclassified Microcoleus]
MSKILYSQILLTATPALICMSLLHSPASSAAEVVATETQEVIASPADLPLVDAAQSQSALAKPAPTGATPTKRIAQIETAPNPASTPEIIADAKPQKQEKPESISLATNSEKTAEISQTNDVNQTNIASEKSTRWPVALEPNSTETKPAQILEPTADISPELTTNKKSEVAAASQPNNLQPADTATQESSESNLLSESIQTPEKPAPTNITQVQADSLEATNPSASPEMEQVTSVSQLSDVKPTDWAFQALQSLVERYGCIAGYPDGTYRGNRAMTRYEFAAGLNACLDKVAELITAGTSNLVKKEDLQKLQRLQEEFAAELATLRGRIDILEARTANLESNQLSTTTKLNATVWFNLTSAFPTGDITAERSRTAPESPFATPTRDANNRPTRVERGQPETTFSYYAFLTLNTSFTGKDSLVTQLVFGNGNSPANELVSGGFYNSWGSPFLDQTGAPTANAVGLREMSYTFPVGDKVQVAIGPRLNYYRYFDGNRFTFFLKGATSFNSNGSTLLNAVDRGSGAAVTWQVAKPLRFTAAYMAENTEFLNPAVYNTASNPRDGLFNSSNTMTAQLEYAPSNSFNLRLLYARSSLKPYNGFIGGAVGEPLPYGYADDGFGGRVRDSGADTFVVNFDWLLSRNFGLFGRYSYGQLEVNPVNRDRSGGDIKVQSLQVGMGFPDLGKQGALGVLSFVVPHDYISGRRFLLSGGGNGGTQYEVEGSYYYPITNNIAIVPAFYAIFNANNFDGNPTVFVGNLRTQFSF